MYLRTHLMVSFFAILVLIHFVNEKFLFAFVVLIATLIPDLDNRSSKIGKYKIFRPLQFFFGHRGMIHSFSFLILVSILLIFWKPLVALGFFVGFGLHLIFDGFTQMGIYPFWPLKKRWRGFIKTGGKFESFIFSLFLVVDLILFVSFFIGVF